MNRAESGPVDHTSPVLWAAGHRKRRLGGRPIPSRRNSHCGPQVSFSVPRSPRAQPAAGSWCLPIAAALLALALAADPSAADPVDLPPEAVEGTDHALEAGDTLVSGDLELGMGVSGVAEELTSRRRRVRFSEPDLRGTVREGGGDPLAGGRVEGGGRSVDLAVGTLAPRWTRGLVLGAAGDPWQRAALVRGGRPGGRSGEGVALRSRLGPELILGRFARTELVAARCGLRAVHLGAVASRRGAQTSFAIEGAEAQGEIAVDRGGAWRGEALLERRVGGTRVVAAVRAGHSGFRSLAEPARAGPARATTLASETRSRLGDLRVLGSTWKYRAGEAGGRLAIELERRLASGAELALGFEEQHGVRREHQRDPGMRQGGWLEWARLTSPLGLAARHEVWSAGGALRVAVREVTAVRAVAVVPGGMSLSLGHALYRVRRGESLYLREAESDRVLLRALTGQGHRTRLDVAVPLARGTLRAALHLDVRERIRRAPRWDLEWSRRSRAPRRATETKGGALMSSRSPAAASGHVASPRYGPDAP